jgi:hypothetical protein
MAIASEKLFLYILLVLFAFLNVSTVVISQRANSNARTAVISSRCSVRTLLSYPPPSSQGDADIALLAYDKCIKGG